MGEGAGGRHNVDDAAQCWHGKARKQAVWAQKHTHCCHACPTAAQLHGAIRKLASAPTVASTLPHLGHAQRNLFRNVAVAVARELALLEPVRLARLKPPLALALPAGWTVGNRRGGRGWCSGQLPTNVPRMHCPLPPPCKPPRHKSSHVGSCHPAAAPPAPLLPNLLALAPLLPLLPALPLPGLPGLPLITAAPAAAPPCLPIVIGRDVHVGGGAAAVAGRCRHRHRIGAALQPVCIGMVQQPCTDEQQQATAARAQVAACHTPATCSSAAALRALTSTAQPPYAPAAGGAPPSRSMRALRASSRSSRSLRSCGEEAGEWRHGERGSSM